MDAQTMLLVAAAFVFGTILGIVIGRSSRKSEEVTKPDGNVAPADDPYAILGLRNGSGKTHFLIVPYREEPFGLTWDAEEFRARYASAVEALGFSAKELFAESSWGRPSPKSFTEAINSVNTSVEGDASRISVLLGQDSLFLELPKFGGPRVVRESAYAAA